MMAALPDPTGGAGAIFGWISGHVLGGAASDLALAPINALASSIANAVGQLLVTLGTLWISLDVPNVWTGGTTSGTVAFLHSEVAPLVGLLAVLGIIIGAVRMAVAQRGQPGIDLVQGIFILVLVTGCGVPIIGMLTSGADAWAHSIIENATNGTDFGRNIASMLALAGPRLAPALTIMFGIVAVCVSGLMICLLAFRAAMLVMLAGFLPIAAAMTTTQAGREHMRKYLAWVIAFVAWKPCAALIYAAAFRLLGTHNLDATGAGSVLIGVTLMTMAILALPALLRFLVPAVAALHASSPTTAAAVAASSMPPGAKMLRHAQHVAAGAGAVAGVRGPSGAQGGPSGPTGPSGSASPPTPPAVPPTPPVRPPSPVT
jgi:type IV secretion system protein TrbL